MYMQLIYCTIICVANVRKLSASISTDENSINELEAEEERLMEVQSDQKEREGGPHVLMCTITYIAH